MNQGGVVTTDEEAVVRCYERLLTSWDDCDAQAFGALFASNGHVVGFDGSQLDGRDAITREMTRIFDDHMPASYVSKVVDVRCLSSDVALLRAVAGMVPPGSSAIKQDKNAVQSLVATRTDGDWAIALYQNTPAQWHGRPDDVAALTQELQSLVKPR